MKTTNYRKQIYICPKGHTLDDRSKPCSHCARYATRVRNGNTRMQRKQIKENSTKVLLTPVLYKV